MSSEINVPVGPAAESAPDPRHVEAMVAKAEGVEVPTPANPPPMPSPAPEEGKKFAGKFNSAEELEKAYIELQRKLGQASQRHDSRQEAPQAKPVAANESAARQATAEAGFDYDALVAEYEAEGTLREETFAALERRGIPRSVVEAYIRGAEAVQTLGRMEVFAEVGGEEQYKAMTAWARDNLSPAEIEAYNRVAMGSDFGALKMAAKGLYARYLEATGKEPALLAASPASSNSGGYTSWEEVKRDMSDPRYIAFDPAFRAEVLRKLALFNG